MASTGADAVIWGITKAGRAFRPSDWAERLAGLTSAFGRDQKVTYSPHVSPVIVQGVRAVIVGHELAGARAAPVAVPAVSSRATTTCR